MLLSKNSRQEILKIIKEYRSARIRLMRNYKSRRARIICDNAYMRADHYIDIMNMYEGKITSEDVKYFALIVDNFGQMRRESMLNRLQKYADFDVFWYVEQYNIGLIKNVSNPVKNDLYNMSAKQMDSLCVKYKSICNDLQKNRNVSHNVVLADRYRSGAYAYFIYREYGFKIDVLDMAVNSNQKLTQQQQSELVRVIMDAGERGTGVQQMAKQKVEARGGQISHHSKFKNATKQQQRQHLVNIGLLKKAHVR